MSCTETPCLAQVDGGPAPLGSGGWSVPPDATLRAFVSCHGAITDNVGRTKRNHHGRCRCLLSRFEEGKAFYHGSGVSMVAGVIPTTRHRQLQEWPPATAWQTQLQKHARETNSPLTFLPSEDSGGLPCQARREVRTVWSCDHEWQKFRRDRVW